ncbi:MAG: oligosaccharide flippase family protein [Bacteroidota bacterium]
MSLTVLLNLLVKPAWILTEFWVHNQIGHESWGTYASLLSFAFLFIALSDLGINQYAIQRLAGSPELFHRYFPNMLGTKLFLVTFYPLAILGLGYLWGFPPAELYLLVLLAFIYGGTQLKQFYRANFQAMQAFQVDAFASVTERAILLIFAWILLYTFIDIERFVYARLIAIGLSIILFSFLLANRKGSLGIAFEIPKIRKVLTASFSFALVTVLYSFLDKVDQVMLERICGDRETSLYAAAYRGMDAIHMYLMIILTIFFARFAHFISDFSMQSRLLRLAQVLTALPLLFISVVVFFYGEILISLLFTNSSAEEIETMTLAFKILFVSTLTNGLFMVYSTLLSSTGSIKFVNKVVLGGILLNVLLNLYLIPIQGATGAAWATTITLGCMGICYVVRLAVLSQVQVPWDLLLKIVLVGVMLTGIFYWAKGRAFLPMGTIFITGLIYTALCWILGLIPAEVLPPFLKRGRTDE